MRIAALLGVMDEVELLPRCLEHLYRIGVDAVLARDGGSTDGSLELLLSLQGERLRVERIGEDEIGDHVLCSRREAEAVRSLEADWVVFLDADEFWLPATGSLRDGPQWHDEAVDMIQVQRYNVALARSGPLAPALMAPQGYAETALFARAVPHFRKHLQEQPLTPWITGVPVAKFAARPGCLASVDVGWHGAQGRDGKPIRRQPSADIVVAHLPFTTESRFRRKVDNIRRMLSSHPECFPPDSAWHWRRWAALPSASAVEHEFALQCLSDAELAALRADGALRSAAELLPPLR